MMRTLGISLAIGLGLYCASARADSEWLLIGDTPVATWEGHVGTIRTPTNRSGVQVVAAEGRVTNKRTTLITFEQWYVTFDDCRAGKGKLVTLDMDGNFKFETDFVLNGGSVASGLADVLCASLSRGGKKGI